MGFSVPPVPTLRACAPCRLLLDPWAQCPLGIRGWCVQGCVPLIQDVGELSGGGDL